MNRDAGPGGASTDGNDEDPARPEPHTAAALRRVGLDYDFELDRFQLDAIASLDAGHSVLVAAPTGAGKTVVAEYAVAKALAEGGRAFYTTPIKALSNQKFGDLRRRHGAERVGLLTGDNSINGDAPVVVMTTEVLRNMIYQGAPLHDLRYVVLDEVHYLQDAYRGPVWEEVIIHAPRHVRLVALSATVSNAAELAEWITTVRGATDVVVETERPIQLANLYLVGDKSSERLHLTPVLVDGRPNPEGERFDRRAARTGRGGRGRPRQRFFTPRRIEVVEELHDRDMLPAIYFIFSRAACDDAVGACLAAGLSLTTPDERSRIKALAEERAAPLSDADLAVLGYDRFLAGLLAGVTAHHAGMVPPFKEAVEDCFAEGLVKAVFATETLALGINMPARTVVIEKLTKWSGERNEPLTAGQYTQLTGRAGRRGIDQIGHAVVLWSPFVTFGEVAGLAANRSFVLRSAFRPTYNMAANLVSRYSEEAAHQLLNSSFAQFQADRSVVQVEQRLAQRREQLDATVAGLGAPLEELRAYRELRRAAEAAESPPRAPEAAVESALSRLSPGQVILVPRGRGADRLAVVSVAYRRAGTIRLAAVSPSGRLRQLRAADFAAPPEVIGRIDLPSPYAPHSQQFLHRMARELRMLRGGDTRPERDPLDAPAAVSAGARRAELEAHPLHARPGLDADLRMLLRVDRLERDLAELLQVVRGGAETVARRFRRLLDLLERWGYLDGWRLTARGRLLARVYHESDLLIVESLAQGLLDGLDPASLAGLVSTFSYESRSAGPPSQTWYPSAKARERAREIGQLAERLNGDEERARLALTRPPDGAFVALAYAWAAGEDLDTVLEDEELSGGDFVRNVKQLIDLLRQIGELHGDLVDPTTARAARQGADALFRGVVLASAAVDEPS
ncbi:MAG: DEAD/DEAH box helicase [Acidimicrobiales bacterium]